VEHLLLCYRDNRRDYGKYPDPWASSMKRLQQCLGEKHRESERDIVNEKDGDKPK
jgi:hypothetical protein